MNRKTITLVAVGLLTGLLLPYFFGRELTINFRFHHTIDFPFLIKKK